MNEFRQVIPILQKSFFSFFFFSNYSLISLCYYQYHYLFFSHSLWVFHISHIWWFSQKSKWQQVPQLIKTLVSIFANLKSSVQSQFFLGFQVPTPILFYRFLGIIQGALWLILVSPLHFTIFLKLSGGFFFFHLNSVICRNGKALLMRHSFQLDPVIWLGLSDPFLSQSSRGSSGFYFPVKFLVCACTICIVKFYLLAQFPVDHFAHPVMLALVLFWCQFAAFTYYCSVSFSLYSLHWLFSLLTLFHLNFFLTLGW